jgi:hypothetical protein
VTVSSSETSRASARLGREDTQLSGHENGIQVDGGGREERAGKRLEVEFNLERGHVIDLERVVKQ